MHGWAQEVAQRPDYDAGDEQGDSQSLAWLSSTCSRTHGLSLRPKPPLRRIVPDLGGDRAELVLQYCGRGHTAGDMVAWIPRRRVLFARDPVEAHAALYTGDAFTRDWSAGTLDRVRSLRGAAAPHPGGCHYRGLLNQSCADFIQPDR